MGKNISAAIVGNGIEALQAALYLAQIGISVKFITPSPSFSFPGSNQVDERLFWSTVLNAIKHPLIDFIYNTHSVEVCGNKGNFTIQVQQSESFIDSDLCTGCKKCEQNCSTLMSVLKEEKTLSAHAVHKPYPGSKSVPSALVIDKNKVSPCRASCPLGINVQGFVSLLANNKVDEACELINRSAPLGGILGRLCKHPCESECNRIKIDSPVSIRALHRYAYDNVSDSCAVIKEPINIATKGKVAIIGSGPAGLMAAWDLKRRGYEPTVFESHNTYGGMLATGIPRFRMSREIREREINKLLDLGIKIRTGITVGRDIDFAYLKERGYKAYFLAIGASKNNKLGIPGEDLEGVIDCMSFLITLNQMDDLFVGSNIVVIGDGNTAVDSARSAIRQNIGAVKIVSWTVPEELTASEDEIQEAFEEGVSIEYSAFPVEILGDGGKVVGIRCQRTKLTDYIMRNGRHRPEPIPGTDFIIDADHVIVAIGQSADASQLNLEGLNIDRASGTVKVNPVTLETSVRGFFAGGDCMRGPNHVVAAMADGLTAAESIDRYLSNRDMETDRDKKHVDIAEVDVHAIVASTSPRSSMPYLDIDARKSGYEETTLGLSAQSVSEEAKRCLNCALCSECMECVKVCGANAISHDHVARLEDFKADIVLKFDASVAWPVNRDDPPGVYDFTVPGKPSNVMTGIMRTILDMNVDSLAGMPSCNSGDASTPGTGSNRGTDTRIGIFLCRCNGNNSDAIDFERLAEACNSLPDVKLISHIEQSCAPEGAKTIGEYARDQGINYAVVAACRCCNYDQVCYSCNDRRILCQKYLSQNIAAGNDINIKYVNIRELCAWVYKGSRITATEKAARMIEAAVKQRSWISLPALTRYPIKPTALFADLSGTNRISAMTVETLGFHVDYLDSSSTASNMPGGNLVQKQMPRSLDISGFPGNYTVKLGYAEGEELVQAGAIILNSDITMKGVNISETTYWGRLLRRVISRRHAGGEEYNRKKYDGALAKAGLFLIDNPGDMDRKSDGGRAIGIAAQILQYFGSHWVTALSSTARIDTALCRSCAKCAERCPLIDSGDSSSEPSAFLEQCLCTGCGNCTTACPTAAIYLGGQNSDDVSENISLLLSPIKI
jgi:NADPH-dependent glutamate synthase beta subunit-like oxidoreductase/NAD-dependent dihydropyrimidine dehydrogenase PreA subunit